VDGDRKDCGGLEQQHRKHGFLVHTSLASVAATSILVLLLLLLLLMGALGTPGIGAFSWVFKGPVANAAE